MVKINISVEGEDLADIVGELLDLGTEILKSNKKKVREIMDIFVDEALGTLMEHKTLEKGAQLYKKINSEINWTYRKDKQ